MSQSITYEFEDSKEWRDWLNSNYSSQTEAWLIIRKKKSQKKGLKYQEAVEEAICFGWIDSKMQRIDEEKLLQRFSPRRKSSIWSKKNKETAKKMIQEAKMTEAGLKTIELAKENGKWETAYSSKRPPEIPKDLIDALLQNELAWKNFNEFSNSAKIQYVYWVTSAKKDETRQKRISEVMKKATQNIKPA